MDLAAKTETSITKDGKILCVYENGNRDDCEKLSILQVDPKWLLAGKSAGGAKEPGGK